MKIELRFRGLEASDSLREHTVRRIHLHLSRFGQDVSAVAVRIGDVNGPRGGLDKRCRITVRGPRLRLSTLEELSADAYAAVDSAVARVARAVGRDLERARDAKGDGQSVRKAP